MIFFNLTIATTITGDVFVGAAISRPHPYGKPLQMAAGD